MNATTTRRALLAGAPAAALAGMLAAPTSAIAAPAGISTDLAAAIRAHAAARVTVNAFRSEVFGPIEEAYFALGNTVPHHTTVNSFTNVSGEVLHLTTSDSGTVRMSRSILRDFDAGTHYQSQRDSSYIATLRELVDASDTREGQIASANDALGYDAAEAHLQALEEADCEAIDRVVKTPARSHADLLAKVEFLQAEGAWDFHGAVAQIVADVRRLAATREA